MTETDLLPVIRSERLDLVLFSPELVSALIAHEKDEAQRLSSARLPDGLFPATDADRDFLRMRRDQVRSDTSWTAWSLRAVILRESAVVIGTVNFHGPPGINDTATRDAAEVGYEIVPAYRNNGFATEAAHAMMAWANRVHGVTHFIFGIAPDNRASLRVGEKLGFVPTGEMVDGELIFESRW
jgi:[ribosomal protein S5]-alanine N-acetyltransferase